MVTRESESDNFLAISEKSFASSAILPFSKDITFNFCLNAELHIVGSQLDLISRSVDQNAL